MDESLTSSSVLIGIPDAVQDEIRKLAAEKLARLTIPRLRLLTVKKRRERRREEESAANHAQVFTFAQALEKGVLTRHWTAEEVERLEEDDGGAALVRTDASSIVTYDGDTHATGVWVLLSGTVHCVKRRPNFKSHRDADLLTVHNAPYVIGMCSGMTGRERSASVVSVSLCLWKVVRRSTVLASFRRLDHTSREAVEEALARRMGTAKASVKEQLASVARYLTWYPVFGDLPPASLRLLVRQFERHFVPANTTLAVAGTPCQKVIVLTKGEATATLVTGAKSNQRVGEVLGGTCLANHQWHITLVTTQPCEVWTISRGHLKRESEKHRVFELLLFASTLVMTRATSAQVSEFAAPQCAVSEASVHIIQKHGFREVGYGDALFPPDRWLSSTMQQRRRVLRNAFNSLDSTQDVDPQVVRRLKVRSARSRSSLRVRSAKGTTPQGTGSRDLAETETKGTVRAVFNDRSLHIPSLVAKARVAYEELLTQAASDAFRHKDFRRLAPLR